MADIRYERTWCDYLTNCKHRPDIEVGSYECSQCKFHAGFHENAAPERGVTDMRKYSDIIEGVVNCNYEEQTSNNE